MLSSWATVWSKSRATDGTYVRILLVILQFAPDVNSNGLLFTQIAADLVQRGHHVTVVTSFPHYEHFRVWPEYRGKLAQRERREGLDIVRLYIHARGRKQRFTDRFLSYFSFSVLAFITALCLRQRYDVIVCPNGGFLTAVAAVLVGRLKRVPVLLNLQDLYPETPIRTGLIRDTWIIGILRWLEQYIYRGSAHISVITAYFREFLVQNGVPAERISVIPNFVDAEFIRPLPRDNDFSRRHGLAEKFVVSHAGNIGYAYDLETLIEAASLLRSDRDIAFLIVGDGVVKPILQERVRALNLENVQFMSYQPREDVPLLRAASDVQVALNRPGASLHSMPSKVYEIMASARPLLASADSGSDLAILIDGSRCGIVVEPRDARALADAIMRLHAAPELRQEMGARGRRLAETQYSRSAVVDQYERLLLCLAGGRDQPRVQESTTVPGHPERQVQSHPSARTA